MITDESEAQTPAEKVAYFLSELIDKLDEQDFTSETIRQMVVTATPAVVSYYLKGQ